MLRLVSQPKPTYINGICNGLKHWLSETKDLDADSIKKLAPEIENIFHIVNLGLMLPGYWELTATLMAQLFPLPDRNGYWNLWLEKLQKIVAKSPSSVTPLSIRLKIQQGKLQRTVRDVEAAIETHQQAKVDAEKIEDEALLAYAYLEIGWDYLIKNDLVNAQKFGEKAIQIFGEDTYDANLHRVDTLRLLGSVERDRGNIQESIAILKKARWGAVNIGTPIVLARTYIDLGVAYQRKPDILEAMECFGRASEVLLRTTYEGDKASVFLNMGTLYFIQGEWKAAEVTFKLVNSRYLREIGDLTSLAILWNNLGNVFGKQDKLEQAEKFLNDALDIWEETGNAHLQKANTLVSLSEVLVKKGEIEEALQLNEEVKNIVVDYPDHIWAKDIKNELIDVELEIKRRKKHLD